jgi:hypothetical protein
MDRHASNEGFIKDFNECPFQGSIDGSFKGFIPGSIEGSIYGPAIDSVKNSFLFHDLEMTHLKGGTQYTWIDEKTKKIRGCFTLEKDFTFSEEAYTAISLYREKDGTPYIQKIKRRDIFSEVTEICECDISEIPKSIKEFESMYDKALEKAKILIDNYMHNKIVYKEILLKGIVLTKEEVEERMLNQICTVKCWQKTFSNATIVDFVSSTSSFSSRDIKIIIRDRQYNKYIIDPHSIISIEEC